jgi:hypothetical protein
MSTKGMRTRGRLREVGIFALIEEKRLQESRNACTPVGSRAGRAGLGGPD